MSTVDFHVGTSGWAYRDWVGSFYPKTVKAADRLAYYCTRFDTLEINASFYRLPSQSMIDAWNRILPADFRLAVKGSRMITHLKRLEECEDAVSRFLDRVMQLRTLRVILWQLPPRLPQDPGRLDRFLASLPRSVRHAIEFRHETWWHEDTAAVLSDHAASFVAISHPGLPATFYPTTDLLYLRFHGLGEELYHYEYSQQELAEWVTRLTPHVPTKAVYAFFNNGYEGAAIRNAMAFRQELNRSAERQLE